LSPSRTKTSPGRNSSARRSSASAAFFTGAVFGAAIGYAIGWNNHDIYHGDVNINNTINVSRNFNNANINRTTINNQRSKRVNNREKCVASELQRNVSGGAARPSVTPNQISAGLAQRGGTRPGANGANGTQGRNIGAATASPAIAILALPAPARTR
jgi:hypothetical protein